MAHVGIFAAKNNLSALVEQALDGEEVVLTRHGTPVAMIVPYTGPSRAHVFGALAHLLPPGAHDWSAVTEPMSDGEAAEWHEGHSGDPLRGGP